MRARDPPVQAADGVRPPRELQTQHGHAEVLAVVLRLDAAEAHQLLKRNAQLVAQRAEVLFDQSAVETVVPGGHGGVRRESRMLGDLPQRFIKT